MVEGARLESVYRLIAYQEFESLALRQFLVGFFVPVGSVRNSKKQQQPRSKEGILGVRFSHLLEIGNCQIRFGVLQKKPGFIKAGLLYNFPAYGLTVLHATGRCDHGRHSSVHFAAVH